MCGLPTYSTCVDTLSVSTICGYYWPLHHTAVVVLYGDRYVDVCVCVCVCVFMCAGLLLRIFSYWYDMDVIEEESFFKWKEDVPQEFPGKGQALFQVSSGSVVGGC